MSTIAEDLAAAPNEKIVRIEITPIVPGVRVVGGIMLDSRLYDRDVARRKLHALVEDMLDKIYPPPPPRKSTAEIEMDMAHEINMRLQKKGNPFL